LQGKLPIFGQGSKLPRPSQAAILKIFSTREADLWLVPKRPACNPASARSLKPRRTNKALRHLPLSYEESVFSFLIMNREVKGNASCPFQHDTTATPSGAEISLLLCAFSKSCC